MGGSGDIRQGAYNDNGGRDTLKKEEERFKMYASDISKKAVKVASKNAKELGCDVEFMVGDMLAPIREKNIKLDILVSNPPYIPKKDIETLHTQVKDYEPYNALEGGEDGLDFYRQITKESIDYLKQGGILAYEVGHDQAEDVSEIMKSYGYTKIYKKKDIQGIDRVVIGFKL